jgi:hypothetical protein
MGLRLLKKTGREKKKNKNSPLFWARTDKERVCTLEVFIFFITLNKLDCLNQAQSPERKRENLPLSRDFLFCLYVNSMEQFFLCVPLT